MKRDTVRQSVVVLAIVVMVAVNALANALPINGRGTGEISDSFSTYFVPAGYVFSIWGLIYLGLAAYAVYQALPRQRENPRLRRVGPLVVLSSVANAVWIFLWHYEQFVLTLLVMLLLLVSLILTYLWLGTGKTSAPVAERWLVRLPFSLYLGWITVATVANATQVLEYLGWGGFGLSEATWAVVMLVAATAIAAAVSLTRGDIAYMGVIIWAFIGIALKHAATPVVAITAWVLTGANFVLLVVGALLRRRN
jgi:translocator protein